MGADRGTEQMNAESSPKGILKRGIDVVKPSFTQVAALCLRDGRDGPEVLLIRTLTRKLWMIPKGWPIDGLTLAQAAAQEAWEEAGIRGRIADRPIGAFDYTKIKQSGLPVQCRAQVFRLDVSDVLDDFPEADKRSRSWHSPKKASKLVETKGLARLLAEL
jgi:8-oxo-dGTP pyrophosphatase MutT (NUDIX family)